MSLKDDLMRDEGKRMNAQGNHVAYRDSVGYWTVGYGHLLGSSPRMSEISEREAQALLDADMEDAAKLAGSLVGLDYDEVRWRALVNMAFNLGNHLESFVKFLAAFKAKDWLTAAQELTDSKWFGQVGHRAIRIRDMILNGVE